MTAEQISNDLASQGRFTRAGVLLASETHKLFQADDLNTIQKLMLLVDVDFLSEPQLLALLDATRHGGAPLLCHSDAGRTLLGKHREAFVESYPSS